MKVTLVLTGHFRTLDKCWPALRAMFDGHDVSTIVLWSEPLLRDQMARIVHPDLILDVPEVKVDPGSMACWTHRLHVSAIEQMIKQQALIPVLRDVECDLMCRLRPDLKVLVPLEPLDQLHDGHLHLPEHSDFLGVPNPSKVFHYPYGNQFAIGPKQDLLKYFDRHKALGSYYGEPGDEKYLQWYLDREGVSVRWTQFTCCLLRTDGSTWGPYR